MSSPDAAATSPPPAAAAAASSPSSPPSDKPKERRHKKAKDEGADGAQRHHHRHSHKHDSAKKNKLSSAAESGRDVEDGEEDWDENRAAVERLCAQYPNNICADCGDTGTRWTSVNHGVFVCIRCSGVHRSLGVHISKVKSTNMDRWLLAEVRLMEAVGNAKAKALYEARLPAGLRPSAIAGAAGDDAVKSFIQRKYAQREFAMHNLRDVLGRLYKDTGYGRPKSGAKAGGGGGNNIGSTSTSTSTSAVPAPVDRAAVTGKRGDTMRALYGDAAADMQRGASRRKGAAEAGAKGATAAAAAAPKPTYGSFGMVNVPPDEYDARWQRTLAVFTQVASPADAPQQTSATEGDDCGRRGRGRD